MSNKIHARARARTQAWPFKMSALKFFRKIDFENVPFVLLFYCAPLPRPIPPQKKKKKNVFCVFFDFSFFHLFFLTFFFGGGERGG